MASKQALLELLDDLLINDLITRLKDKYRSTYRSSTMAAGVIPRQGGPGSHEEVDDLCVTDDCPYKGRQ